MSPGRVRPGAAVLPGAEPFAHPSGPGRGVLLRHGFTSTPQSLRGWGGAFAASAASADRVTGAGRGQG
ncbi:hypothetical protein NUM3379_31750 [Kineococcus sp. NUM-3379]